MDPHYPEGNVFYRNLHYSYPLVNYGRGSYLYDVEGKKYLDASGGAAVANIGHGVKEIVEAISSQAQNEKHRIKEEGWKKVKGLR